MQDTSSYLKMKCGYLLLLVLLLITDNSLAIRRGLEEIVYSFTTCNTKGREGPSPNRCQRLYNESRSPLTTQDLLFRFQNNDYEGAQGFKIPRETLYNVTVAGAAGGIGICSFEYGFGLKRKVQIHLSLDYEILVLVGQEGSSPCELDSSHILCQNPPRTATAADHCMNMWRDWINEAYESQLSDVQLLDAVYLYSGGAGGGGASMIWPRTVADNDFLELPLVISAGGGGGAAVLDYNTAINSSELNYRMFINADTSSNVTGTRGYRSPNTEQFLYSAGAGGGWYNLLTTLNFDGQYLSQADRFAEGGADCGQMLASGLGIDVPFESVNGGFGGGGGGCGGGGGGGGFHGGGVLAINSNMYPGGGGYSLLENNSALPLYFIEDGFNDSDGFVDIVPADCNCAHQCVVYEEDEQFECRCPNNTFLAPDQFDCFEDREVDVLLRLWDLPTTPEGFTITTLNISSPVLLYSLAATLNIQSTEGSAGPGSGDGTVQESCVMVLFGSDTGTIIVSNPIRVQGLANQLVRITDGQELTSLAYVSMLEQPVHVTSGFLLSSGDCAIEDQQISVNGSIRPAGDVGGGNIQELVGTLLSQPEAISELLGLSATVTPISTTAMATESSTTAMTTARTASTSTLTVVISIITCVGGFLLIVTLTMGCLLGYQCNKRNRGKANAVDNASVRYHSQTDTLTTVISSRQPQLPSRQTVTAADGYEILDVQPEVDGVDPKGTYVPPVAPGEYEVPSMQSARNRSEAEKCPDTVIPQYEELQITAGPSDLKKSEYTDLVTSRTASFSPMYGISAPEVDFVAFNKLRTEANISEWEVPRSSLIYIRDIGEGNFGKVLLMKTKSIAGYADSIPVAVKTLSSRDPQKVAKFLEEVKLMKKFSHPNIVSLLGVSIHDQSEDDPAPLMILEYMPFGDLKSLLESHRPSDAKAVASMEEWHIYSFAIDIAKGMEFLALQNYVHRDLAARNCLVGPSLRIKIADFGLARDIYDDDYYRVAGQAVLPVRWMAPECILYGIFTTTSDVWAYGVVLWEIMTNGDTPLKSFQVKEVVALAQNGTLQHPKPSRCVTDVYGVMCQCHKHEANQRPSFTEILATFEREDDPVYLAMH